MPVQYSLTDATCCTAPGSTWQGLSYLMDRLGTTRDPLLLKIIRNISHWTFNLQQELDMPDLQYKYRGLWGPHIKVGVGTEEVQGSVGATYQGGGEVA